MKEYDLTVNGNMPVDFAPESEAAEIIQNVRTVIATPKYSVPLFREFGLDYGAVDAPEPSAIAGIKSDIIMAVRKYEPRARVSYIDIEPGNDGKISLRIRIVI